MIPFTENVSCEMEQKNIRIRFFTRNNKQNIITSYFDMRVKFCGKIYIWSKRIADDKDEIDKQKIKHIAYGAAHFWNRFKRE
jgi:hypothetical protein